jgi:hypothetical protein
MQYSHVFARLVDAFTENGLELTLIHVGSWGHDVGRPTEEWSGRLRIRDITHYAGMSFRQILEHERPVAVLFLSMQPFAHRAFNRYCKQLGIPTLHMYHGIVRVQDTTLERVCPIDWRSHLARIATVVWKNLTRVWPAYVRSLWDTRAPINDLRWFGIVVWRQILGTSYSGIAAPDAATTAICVYTPADIAHAVNRYRLPIGAVHAVGNPDLERFGVASADLGVFLSTTDPPSNAVMYIDCAFIDIGLVFAGLNDYTAHMVQTNKALLAQGFRMVVKLHPAHFRTGLRERLVDNGIDVCENDAFLTRLKNCCACISEPSSLAVIPALIGMPLLLAAYGKMRDQRYGEVLTSYPRVQRLTDIASFESAYSALRGSIDREPVDEWIAQNAGPLPANEIPQRIVRIVSSFDSAPAPVS